jgi:trigger factor
VALMRAKHNVLNVVAEVPDNDYYREKGWEKVSDDTPTTVEADLAAEGDAFRSRVEFDPSAHTVKAVVEHIQTAPEAEAARVLEAEKSGRARKSVVEL